jgi:RNA polymerase sigma-70 factor (ECF subfamily)
LSSRADRADYWDRQKGGIMDTVNLQSKEESSAALLRRCLSNDPDAYNELYTKYNRRIFNTAYKILGEESSAEDALQETLLNVYRGLSKFRGDSKVSTWISRITINVCLGMLRKGKNKRFIELEDEMTGDLPAEDTSFTNPLAYAQLEELRSFVRQTLNRMSEKQSEVVRLHDMEGNTIQEIAEIIDCPVGTVKSRLFYGRQEFKAIYTSLVNDGFGASLSSMN